MASGGENLNASQFYITLRDDLDYLDEKHTVGLSSTCGVRRCRAMGFVIIAMKYSSLLHLWECTLHSQVVISWDHTTPALQPFEGVTKGDDCSF